MIHKNYDILSEEEKQFVDGMFSRDVFKQAAVELGYPLIGNDEVERAVEAVSTWLVESSKTALCSRIPFIKEGTKNEIGYIVRF